MPGATHHGQYKPDDPLFRNKSYGIIVRVPTKHSEDDSAKPKRKALKGQTPARRAEVR